MNTDTYEWFTLDDIVPTTTTEKLYCIAVDSEDKQFLVGNTGIPTHNTEEGKAEDLLKGEAAMIIGSIARLGRAAGVHLVIATQRPDATLIAGEVKANLGVRINCGRSDSNASNMILGSGEGARVRANPRGRLYLKIYGEGNHGQGLFADKTWLDEYLASQGLNPDGSPLSQPQSKLAKLTNFDEFSEGDLDSREGIDNSATIDEIRASERASMSEGQPSEISDYQAQNEHSRWGDDDDWGEDDWEDDNDTWRDVSVDHVEKPEQTPPADDRPILTNKTDSSRFTRPEDDWDNELEDLINENFSE